MFVRRFHLLFALAVSASLASCDNSPTGPGASSGILLEATVDGTPYSFTLEPSFQTYDLAGTLGRFGGSTSSGATTRTITATFISDITTGAFPRVLGEDQITIAYVVLTNGAVTDQYDCREHPDRCSITLTAKTSDVVDGTFSARLTSRNDTTKHLEITDGAFSVKLVNQ